VLVRSWNVFHGNTSPPGRRAYLREMVELIAADRPEVVCLQEVPAWALGLVGGWAEMLGLGDRTRRGRPLGRRITSLNAGFFRSGFGGQGNAILLPADVKVREHKTITLNTNPFCEEEGRKLGLDAEVMRWWERERRICQVVKYERPDRRRFLVANVHATSYPRDTRLADSELRRATNFVDRQSEVEEVVIFAGDFNVTEAQSRTIAALLEAPPESRWSAAGPRIDHVLVRGAKASAVRVWPDDERRYDGKLLSDHAPVEVELEIPTKS
jgi:endonuclease/exonuclease/phosphatase family metal-dependent hydrolase